MVRKLRRARIRGAVRRGAVGCVAAIALASTATSGEPAPAPAATLFPSAPGTSFVYGGRACRIPAEGTRRTCSRVRWTMRVLTSWQRNQRSVAVVSGFVTDLAWYRPGTKPALTVLLQTPTGLYLQPVQEGQDANAIARHALADGHLWQQLAALPLHAGSCVGSVSPPPASTQADKTACWLAGRPAGIPHAWRLERRAARDFESITFDAARGITAYRYDHQDDTASTNVHLVAETPSRRSRADR